MDRIEGLMGFIGVPLIKGGGRIGVLRGVWGFPGVLMGVFEGNRAAGGKFA